MYISVSTIDLLGPGQHWQNQQVLKCTLEKLKSESCQTKQNKLCQNQQVSKCTLEKLESESCQTKQIVYPHQNPKAGTPEHIDLDLLLQN